MVRVCHLVRVAGEPTRLVRAPLPGDVAGLGVPDHYQGQSLRPLLLDEGDPERDALFFEYFEDPPFPHFPTMVCVRTETEKLIHYLRDGERDEFYDLVADPDERDNVIDDPEYADRVAKMQERLEAEQGQFGFEVPDLSEGY